MNFFDIETQDIFKEGSISPKNKIAEFYINLVNGYSYEFDVLGSSTVSGTLDDPYIRGLFDEFNRLLIGTIDDDGGFGFNSKIIFTPLVSGKYKLRISASNDGIGSYLLQVSHAIIKDDFLSNMNTQANLIFDKLLSASNERPFDDDWFKLNIFSTKSRIIEIKFPLINDHNFENVIFKLISDFGEEVQLEHNYYGEGNFQIYLSEKYKGNYYLSISSLDLTLGDYTLKALEIIDDKVSANLHTLGFISVGDIIIENVNYDGDQDWFKMYFHANCNYTIELKGFSSRKGALLNPTIFGIYNSNGSYIVNTFDENSGLGYDSKTIFTPNLSGYYFVSCGSSLGNIGTYQLSSSLNIKDDFSQDISTLALIKNDHSLKGNIELLGDRDWFALDLYKDTFYKIIINSEIVDKTRVLDLYLYGIYNNNSELIPNTHSDGGNEKSTLVTYFNPYETNTYYVSVGGFASSTGKYTISYHELIDDYDNSQSTNALLTLPDSIYGSIERAGDSDWIKIYLDRDRTYRFYLEGVSKSWQPLKQPFIQKIYGFDGSPLITYNKNLFSNKHIVEYRPEFSSFYFISVSSSNHNMHGEYRLSVEDLTPEHHNEREFNIDINFEGDEKYRFIIDQSVDFWESIIVGDIDDIYYGEYGLIDDLLIDFEIANINQGENTNINILAEAGPTLVRNSSYLPLHGKVLIDETNISLMYEQGILKDVITHEIAHVLGFGTLWNSKGLVEDFSYIGEFAISQYSLLKGFPQTFVPLQKDGIDGSIGTHWSENVFNNEIMTPVIENDNNIISAITLGALQDLGYEIDYSYAELFEL